MNAIEALLLAIIWAALLSPVWLLLFFLLGWAGAERRRSDSAYWQKKRSDEIRRRINEAGL